jgi:ring-1,2-phenylacetyl-CoA epoxidase subunit PaaE
MGHFHRLNIAGVRHETRDAIVVDFDVPPALRDRFAFRAGQYLTLRVVIAGEEVRRSYSICSAEQEGRLRVAIKRVAGGLFSNWANDTLAPGVRLDVMPPAGRFGVPSEAASPRHVLAFAAGSGITPILAILKTGLLAEPRSRFTLLYGNRASSSVLFRDELAALKDQYLERLNLVYVMSRERQDIELFNGRITGDKCRALFRHWVRVEDADLAYVCGPEAMMHGVSAALRDAGMAPERIRIELFAPGSRQPGVQQERTAYGPPASARRTGVTVVMDGNQAGFTMDRDAESVLDAGLRAGLDLRYSCKGGVCSTCRCKVVEGAVDMDVNYALEDYEVARGFVLSCQAFPVTDRLVLDFDAAQ